MKKVITILLISAILTGCGHISEDRPYVAEETTTVSLNAEETAVTTASDATTTTTSAETVMSEVTVEKSSQSVTEKTAESVTTAAANTDIQPKKDNTKSHTVQDNKAQEVQKNESKTTTKAQTSPPRATTAPAVKENKTTTTVRTSPPVVTTKAPPPVTQQPKQTEPPRQTEPPAPKQQVLDYDSLNDQMQTFIDGYDIDYDWLYDKGKNLSHDGTDYGKAVAVCSEAESLGGVNCINYAINAYFMAQGAGLECYIARSSDHDWYGHVATVVKLDGKWYFMEPMDNIVGSPYSYAGGGVDYPNGLDIVTDIYDNKKDVTVESDWYK